MSGASLPESIQTLQDRLRTGGDLNEACITLEDIKDNNPANTANPFYDLIMNIIMLSAEGASAIPNHRESQASRFPEQALRGFKEVNGTDERFKGLIKAIEGNLPELKKIFEQRGTGQAGSIGF